ncbi:hypothetical protein [Kosakonia sp. MUSA4]|uniref:hypothetical protein n=1 Tax=Kosakonia sp. MUSA4 TaxID=2067958 RepID=UPI001ABF969D|nr:hypothetical protein [Kosakonia sp. MUSA4]
MNEPQSISLINEKNSGINIPLVDAGFVTWGEAVIGSTSLRRQLIRRVYHTIYTALSAVALAGRRVIISADRLHPPNKYTRHTSRSGALAAVVLQGRKRVVSLTWIIQGIFKEKYYHDG